jgi:hypothetical protein
MLECFNHGLHCKLLLNSRQDLTSQQQTE